MSRTINNFTDSVASSLGLEKQMETLLKFIQSLAPMLYRTSQNFSPCQGVESYGTGGGGIHTVALMKRY
jgi:hypothetical protein